MYWHVSGVDIGTVFIGQDEAEARAVYDHWGHERMTLSCSYDGHTRNAHTVKTYEYPEMSERTSDAKAAASVPIDGVKLCLG